MPEGANEAGVASAPTEVARGATPDDTPDVAAIAGPIASRARARAGSAGVQAGRTMVVVVVVQVLVEVEVTSPRHSSSQQA